MKKKRCHVDLKRINGNSVSRSFWLWLLNKSKTGMNLFNIHLTENTLKSQIKFSCQTKKVIPLQLIAIGFFASTLIAAAQNDTITFSWRVQENAIFFTRSFAIAATNDFYIDWDGNSRDTMKGTGGWQVPTHTYNNYNNENDDFTVNIIGISTECRFTDLFCDNLKIFFFNVKKSTTIEYLTCRANELTFLDVSGCVSLTYLDFQWNQVSSLNIDGCL